MKNSYEIRGDITAIFVNSPKYGDKEVLISTDKLERVKEYQGKWSVCWNKAQGSFYCFGNVRKENGKSTSIVIHRWITQSKTGFVVDHINHDTLNNTDENLRVCSYSENQQNRQGAAKSNKTSGIRGVDWVNNRWRAALRCEGKYIYVGRFDKLEDAEIAVKEARLKHMPFSSENRVS